MTNGATCDGENNSPSWGLYDLFAWKVWPERFHGGREYIQKFKDAWVQNNKLKIKMEATQYNMPPELLAGVCWIEVGGDPNFIDRVAFEVRSFDWSGPDWVDRNLTITNRPEKTSFGAVSIQIRTAAETLGLDASKMSAQEQSNLAECLQKDFYNIHVVALHLRQLLDLDGLQKNPPALEEEAIRVVGARYNRGRGLSLEQIKKNTSYGDFIVKFWPRFQNLMK
ncbi:hypothetical protein V8J88_12480 [Massilia sp. W12]|uniref:hypothetical protein n=1 Tax=Massilia sp. W12 TaxID=3126507 RepID=UPI0030D0DDFE